MTILYKCPNCDHVTDIEPETIKGHYFEGWRSPDDWMCTECELEDCIKFWNTGPEMISPTTLRLIKNLESLLEEKK